MALRTRTRRFSLQLAGLLIAMFIAHGATIPSGSEELRFCLHGAPKTLDPLLAEDSPSETIRFLTSGTLVRLDRRTQQLLPEIAASWRVSSGNREIEFTLRPGIRFSDGTPVTAQDVVFTMGKVLDPALHSPLGDSFRFGSGKVEVKARGNGSVAMTFPKPVAQIVSLFDNVSILSKRSSAGAGAYIIASYKAGSEIVLQKNPYYWKKDDLGQQLPYIATLRIRIQSNREMELVDFERGATDLIPELTAEMFGRIATKNRGALVDLGLTLDSLVLWFNQSPDAALPAYKKTWFQSDALRKALSLAMNRGDICRIAYLGRAKPGVGPVSPANKTWYNPAIKADPNDPAEARKLLLAAGFNFKNGELYDAQGNRVEFSAITNAGNKAHERILGLIQQDWKQIGIKLTVLTLDFPAIMERITRTMAYEAVMLPMTNIGLDPEDQMNIWLSTSANHQWNPNQKTPATAWEKEVDELMSKIASSVSREDRKRAYDRVQVLVSEHKPFIYIAHPEAQAAIGPRVKLEGAPIWPYVLWGLDHATVHR